MMNDIIDSLPAGYLSFADDGTIVQANAALLRLLGYAPGEIEGLRVEQLLPPGNDVVFNTYQTDPGREGPCQHCHTRIDPAALHFKRFAKAGSARDEQQRNAA